MDQKNRYDFPMKRILSLRKIMAPILKYTIKEYENYSIDEIADKFIIPLKENKLYIQELSEEFVLDSEFSNRKDILFYVKTPPEYGYPLLINIEIENSFPGIGILIKNARYLANLITRQHPVRIDKDGKEVLYYPNQIRIVQIVININPPKNLKNKVVGNIVVPFDLKGGFKNGIYEPEMLEKSFVNLKFDEYIRSININLGNENNLDGIFKYLTKGILSDEPKEVRKKYLKEEIGDMDQAISSQLENIWGSMEYFEKKAEKKGEIKGMEKGEEVGFMNAIRQVVKNMKDQGYDNDQIKQTTNLSQSELEALILED